MGYTEAQARAFINMIAPLMVSEATKRGYTIVSTAIAQAIVEGAAGTSKLAQSPYFNHFGLKAGKEWLNAGKPTVNMRTKEEYVVGQVVSINDFFRAFPGGNSEGVKGYYDFISTKRYSNLKTASNYVEYANMLKADGYATSSSYISTLCNTVRKYGLDIYDIRPNAKDNSYVVGATYTTQSDLNVRETPNGRKVNYEDLTENAKKNAFKDEEGFGILKKGTRVTCKEVKLLALSTWILIPSGWICAKNTTNKYVI